MAKKTLLSENQVSKFMKLANIKQDKIDNFNKSLLKENYGASMPSMEEDEPAADEMSGMDDMDAGVDLEKDMEPEAPSTDADFEGGADDFKEVLKNALREVLPEVMAELEGDEGGMDDMEDMDSELEPDLASDDEEEMDMEDEGEEEEEEEELQEAKHKNGNGNKKDDKKALKPKGGDAKKMKEALSFDNIDLVTDDEIINEVLKRVIRRIV